MEIWKYSEIMTSYRDYQTLLNQIAVLIITTTGLMFYQDDKKKNRISKFLLSLSFVIAIFAIGLGFQFQSQLIDIIPALGLQVNPSSITDNSLKIITIAQLSLLSFAGGILVYTGYQLSKSSKYEK